MATYQNHIYVAIGGRLGDAEQWQTGFRLISDDATDLQAQIDRAAQELVRIDGHVATWWGTVKSNMGGNVHWDFTKVNAIDAAGHYADARTNAIYYAANESGHVGTGTPGPYQNACVVTLNTSFIRGRAARGRMYLPIGQVSTTVDTGEFTSTIPSVYANATATMFNGINDNPGIDWANTRVAVVSAYGPANDVVSVKAGKIPDTQRRRRASLDENYTTAVAVS